MSILNIAIFTFLIGLGLFSYSVYERSTLLNYDKNDLKINQTPKDVDSKKSELPKNTKNFLTTTTELDNELLRKKLEIEEINSQKSLLDDTINFLQLNKDNLGTELFDLKLEISKIKIDLSNLTKTYEKQKNQTTLVNDKNLLTKENLDLISKIKQKDDLIFKLNKQLDNLKYNLKDDKKGINLIKQDELDKLKKENLKYKNDYKTFEQVIREQKQKILELKSSNLIFEKELIKLKKEEIDRSKSDSIIATFTGSLLYEQNKKKIILISSDGTEYTILQDEFPGDLVAKCGLPVSTSSKNRCIVTILAELIFEEDQLILKGKEIKKIIKNN